MSDEPKKPRGRAIEWSDEDLDAMTTPEALMRAVGDAQAAWKDHAPAAFRDLLDAKSEDAEDAG